MSHVKVLFVTYDKTRESSHCIGSVFISHLDATPLPHTAITFPAFMPVPNYTAR